MRGAERRKEGGSIANRKWSEVGRKVGERVGEKTSEDNGRERDFRITLFQSPYSLSSFSDHRYLLTT